MRNDLGQFVGSKYKNIDGVWYRTKCIDCHKWLKAISAKRCLDCYRKKARVLIIEGIARPDYHALHYWVVQRLGKPKVCWQCGATNRKVYHWANLSHEYKWELSDWMRLCVPCHRNYDFKKRNIK